MNILLCSYGHFLTFCLVMDSCHTEEDDKKSTMYHWLNMIGRIFFHSMFICLLCCTYFARSCTEHIYPPIFMAVGIFIFSQQVFDITFHCLGYLVDWENLPHTHIDNLRFNKELFQKQMKVLLFANIVFGTLSIMTMAIGFKFVNMNHKDPEALKNLDCVVGN